MAHQTNIIPVQKDLPAGSDEKQEVQDPICGAKLPRKEARHMLFRADDTYYFCSRECEQKFMSQSSGVRQKYA